MKFKPIKSEKELQTLADEFFKDVKKDKAKERREQMKAPMLTTTIKRPWFADIVRPLKDSMISQPSRPSRCFV